jgi:hypothetical protein
MYPQYNNKNKTIQKKRFRKNAKCLHVLHCLNLAAHSWWGYFFYPQLASEETEVSKEEGGDGSFKCA